ncbi:hypothetical protein ACTFIV_005186 [Dictyostelium citrinum]
MLLKVSAIACSIVLIQSCPSSVFSSSDGTRKKYFTPATSKVLSFSTSIMAALPWVMCSLHSINGLRTTTVFKCMASSTRKSCTSCVIHSGFGPSGIDIGIGLCTGLKFGSTWTFNPLTTS